MGKAPAKPILCAFILLAAILASTDAVHAQGTLTEVTSAPSHGTFLSMQSAFPPFPFDPFPQLNLYTDGAGNYYYDDRGLGLSDIIGGHSAMDDSAPYPSTGTNWEGTNDSGSGGGFTIPSYTITTNFDNYTKFWLAISNSPTQAFVTVESTLPGFTYDILTNSDIGSTNWGLWQTLLATNSITPAPALDLDLASLFFKARLDFGDTFWVNTNPSPQEMVEWLMGTNPVIVANVTYTGSGLARGIFGNGSTVLLNTNAPAFMDKGLILSTGWVTNALGPNNNGGANGFNGSSDGPSNLGGDGDNDLDAAVFGGGPTHDAAVWSLTLLRQIHLNCKSNTSLLRRNIRNLQTFLVIRWPFLSARI